MAYFYGVLLVIFLVCSIYSLINNFSYPALFTSLAGFVVFCRLFLQELSKEFLPLYFWIERLKLSIRSDTTSIWWFNARYNDISSKEVFDNILPALRNSRFKIKSLSETDREIELEIDDTIRVCFTFIPYNESAFNVNEISLSSRKLEISYGRAKQKLSTQIEPFLQLVESNIRPESCSFELNIEFSGNNPFFNVYIARLSPNKVQDFRVVLHVDGNSPKSKTDRVEISKEKVRVIAESTNSFRKLAEDFILITPDTKLLIGDKNA